MDEKEKVMTKLSFSMVSSSGVYALLLGSGVSRSANIKTGLKITLDLIHQYIITNGTESEKVQSSEDAELEQWYNRKFGKGPRYDDVLKLVSKNSSDRRNILNRYFEPTEDDRENGYKIPQDAHKAIARLVNQAISKSFLQQILTG